MADDDESPGWNAIDKALESIYRKQEPFHYGAILPAMLGGNDPLHGISAYRAENPRHWHYVTYGFTELWTKESKDSEISGYGFELTFRLAPRKTKEPPAWPMSMLQNLARYVFSSGNVFDAGHHLNLNGPIALEEKTDICFIAFMNDPQLKKRRTLNGKMQFLQVVGLTTAEYELARLWNTEAILGLMQKRNPMLVTDLDRECATKDPALIEAARAGIERDGSSQGATYAVLLEWTKKAKKVNLRIAANITDDLVSMLKGRLQHGREFRVFGEEQGVVLTPAKANAVRTDKKLLCLDLSPPTVEAMKRTLRAKRGVYTCEEFPELTITVVTTPIKDENGKVVRTVG